MTPSIRFLGQRLQHAWRCETKAHLLDSGANGHTMRTLRTIIMGSMMVLPGLLLALIVWYLAGKPETEPLETLICNGIPLVSIVLGLYFGWQTGEEYSVTYEQ